MASKIKFEYIETKEYLDFPVIVVSDIFGFTRFAEFHNVKFIFRVHENEYPSFVFPHDGAMYKIDGQGYREVEDYCESMKNGFPNAALFYEAKKSGCESFTEFEELKKTGVESKEDFLQAQKGGFVKGFDEFKKKFEQYKSNKNTAIIPDSIDNATKLMKYAMSKGLKTYQEFAKVYDAGYPDVMMFTEANTKGFAHSHDFYSALKAGFSEVKEYEDAKRLAIATKKEYEDFRKLKNANIGQYAMDVFQVIELLKAQENGSRLSLAQIRELLSNEQEKYKRAFIGNDMKVLPLWYSRQLETQEQLQNFFLNHAEAKKNGFYDKETEMFEIFRLSKSKVYIDGSNVAMHGKEEKSESARAENLRKVIDALKGRGFKDITIIADASLRYRFHDKEILESVKQSVNYYEVPSHTSADDFLIEHARLDKCFIISNDTFTDWKVKDKWIALNIDHIRIPFLITEGRVTFTGLENGNGG
ncbi:MAG: hypothetical protein HY960_07445 [Ignavibacteriae bacterium]|nr:hypothetical protein [Ignavibacteriota bacterium]